MYKLIAIDLDGTLLDSKKEISFDNLKLVNRLIQNGYEIVIATGRRYWSAKELTKHLDSHITILANNGNIVRNSEDDKVIISKYLDKDDFKIILQEGKKRGLHPIIHVDYYDEGYDIIIEMDRNHEGYYNYLKMTDGRFRQFDLDEKFELDKVLAMVYAGYREPLMEFHLKIIEKYPERFNSHVMENIEIAEAMLEIMNPSGNKWKTLEEYAKSKGIRKEEIIAIGDDNNDVEMIANAGLGIAMKNGSKLAKEAAKIVTEKDNNNSGLAYELKKILMIK